MPVLRNVYSSCQPRRQRPVTHNGDGWSAWSRPENLNYKPNTEPLNFYMDEASFLSSLGFPIDIPQSNHQYFHSCQQERRPLISFDGSPHQPSTVNASCPPSPESPQKGYTRRGEPGHIPRPRNAFIIFRSSYITGGEGPQNQLSKQAGEVWNRMTNNEKEPYILLADLEKKTHQAKYPNYFYCPRRGSARMKRSATTIKAKDTSELTSSSPRLVSPKSTTPKIASAAATLPADAQLAVQGLLQPGPISASPPPVSPPREDSSIQEKLEVVYSEPNLPAKIEVVVPTAGIRGTELNILEGDDFVPTADIPELELTPAEEPKKVDLSIRPSNQDFILEQCGLGYRNDSAIMLAHLPSMPHLNDTPSTGDAAPSFYFPATFVPDGSFEYSRTDNIIDFWQPPTAYLTVPSHDFSSYPQTGPSPANFPTASMSYNASFFLANDGISDCYQQQSTNFGFSAPQQPTPGFTWPSEDKKVLEDDYSFLSYLFDLNPLNDPFFGYAMY